MSETIRGLRVIKIAAVVMGILIVVGTVVLMVMLTRRPSAPAAPAPAVAPVGNVTGGLNAAAMTVTLDEPAGTSIAGITPIGDGLALTLHGAGPDRVILIDPRTGRVTGRISLTR